MALPVRQQAIYWGIVATVLFLTLWLLGNVILPFVLAGAIAYLLDPVADRLQRLGLSRVLATVTITLFAVILFAILALLVIPTLITQAAQMVNLAPELLARFLNAMTERYPALVEDGSALRRSLSEIVTQLQSRGGQLLGALATSFASLLNVVILIVLVPVITFYLLLDWDRMIARVDALLPRDHAPVIRRIAADIDRTLASFIRGQGLVCLILGVFYAVALMLVGLQFGLVVGAVAGVLTFIPYVGALIGGLLAVGLALFQFWGEWWWIVAVAVIFQVGQFVEGNFLTPNLVGNSVGLHPVWLIFALSAFGALFGFVGVLVAVPVAAALGVIVRYALDRYRDSVLYQGLGDHGPEP